MVSDPAPSAAVSHKYVMIQKDRWKSGVRIRKHRFRPARILVLYVVSGVVLGALGLYQPLVDWGGAGATVPLTGFGNTLAKGVKEAVEKDGLLGVLTGGLKASAGGITAAVFFGLLAAFLFKPKDKS